MGKQFRRRFQFLFLTLLVAPFCFGQGAPAKVKQGSELIINTEKTIYPIHRDFWGTNFLNWIDDDAALSNGSIAGYLKDLKIGVLRFPGGTVADNYHWQSNTLENTNMFPFESGDSESDFDEFMDICRKTGARAAVVLNTETWAVKKDLAGGAHEAANWLRYCRKKGYQVSYWEIGNEAYWHPVMSADEYADLINIYADSLRKIEPAIILGANGHWNTDFVGTKERIKPGTYATLMDYRNNVTSRENNKRYSDYLKANTILPVTTGSDKWWETIARKSGKNIDMIIVHWYFSPAQLPIVTRKLSEVKKLFAAAHPGKKFLLNISEYNVQERSPESLMELTEMVGKMLHAGTDITGLWPMRMKYKKPTFLNVEATQTSNLFQIYRRLASVLQGAVVDVTSATSFPAFASWSGSSASVVMTGSSVKGATSVPVKVNAETKSFKSCIVWRISGDEFDYQIKEEILPVSANQTQITLNPSEVIIATFN